MLFVFKHYIWHQQPRQLCVSGVEKMKTEALLPFVNIRGTRTHLALL